MVFSYPNSTDIYFDVIDSVCNNNSFTFDNNIYNLWDNIIIENNIFGYKLSKIKILNIPDPNKISILSVNTNLTISINDVLTSSEKEIKLILETKYFNQQTYIIEFAGIVSEPDFQDFKNYTDSITDGYESFYEINNYIGRSNQLKINFKNISNNSCDNPSCEINIKYNNEYCISCSNNILFNDVSNEKKKICICMEDLENEEEEIIEENEEEKVKDEETEEEKKEINKEEKEKEEENKNLDTNCTKEEILENKCESFIDDKQSKEIYEYLVDKIINGNYTETKENIIIKAGNIVYQLSKLDEQNDNNLNISIIDLGYCEIILKEKYNISLN